MRNLLTFSLLSALILSIIPSEKAIEPISDKLGDKSRPFEHFYQQRSVPGSPMDVREFTRVMEEVKSSVTQGRGVEEPWTQQGPLNIGGRLNCIAVHPLDEDKIFVGASTGGIFMTEDGGDTWNAVAEDMAYLAIGTIVFDPNNPNTIYVGSGDPNITGLPHPGNGVYKSTDGGVTFTNIGLEEAAIISKIHVAPTNSNIIFATAMGLPFAPSEHKGVYRSNDAGVTWQQVLFVDDQTGAIDLMVNPQNPDKVYAAFWRRVRNNTESIISGESCRIWRSLDGGENWDMLTNGLPDGELCRIGLAMSGSDPDKLFAMVISTEFQLEGIYRSADGGDNWAPLNWDIEQMSNMMGGFGWYFGKIRVNPSDDSEITILGVDMYTTTDNGANWFMSTPPWWEYEVHADKHDMLYTESGDILLATDGGLYKTDANFGAWVDLDMIPNTQFYKVGLDPFDPYSFTGGAQDNGTTTGNAGVIEEWSRDFGGDGFQAYFDPEDDDLRYAATQNGGLNFFDGFFWQDFTWGLDEEDRRNWDMPYIMSSFDNERFYTGTYRMYRMDGAPYGQWYAISEDLTDGQIFEDNFHTISTVAESPVNHDVIYAGTTDANVWRTTNAGEDWDDVTEGLPMRYVTNIKASPETDGTVFVSHSGYKDNDQTSYIHRSDDYGDTWESIAGDLPDLPVNHIEVWNDTTLVIATDVGVYFTENNGENWARVGNNMPLIPVFDLEFNPEGGHLVAATFARSMMTYPLDSLVTEPVIVPNVGDEPEEIFMVYPNPAQDQLRVSGMQVQQTAWVYDAQGRLCLQEQLTPNAVLDISTLNQGQFTLRIGNQTMPFLKVE